jgi:glycosyltransferase involved in cell wall biosynthesis
MSRLLRGRRGTRVVKRIKPLRVMRIIARMNVGGPALQAVTLLRGLPPEVFEQRLYTGFVGPDEADYVDLRAPGLEVHRIPTLGRRIRLADDARALAALAAEMRRFRPHIVHTHTAKAGSLGRTAAILARAPGRVHTFHGHLLHGYFPPRTTRLVVAAERTLARHTDRLIAVGAQVRDDLLEAGIGQPGQYAVVPPGIRLGPLPDRQAARRDLGLPPAGPVVAFVGRLTRIKRPDRLVAVARAVIDAVPGTRFVICGAGDLAAEVSAAANDLGGSAKLLGWRPDVETVYAAADLILLTSDNEGMPVSLIEAGLAGVPAVATNVGSVAEVVQDGSTGLLARCDVAELASRVIRLLGDGALRERLGAAAVAWNRERFGPERLILDVQRLYEAIAIEHRWWPASQRSRDFRPGPDLLQAPDSHRVTP